MTAQAFPKTNTTTNHPNNGKVAATIYCILQTTTLATTIPLHIHQRNFVDDIFYPYNQNLLPITTVPT